jgi:hypothetical protein
MSRFVRPETALLTLANGDTLVVKVRLNTGETRALRAAILSGGEQSHADRAAFPVVLAYLLDWSITDDGRPVVIRDQPPDAVRAVLDALEYESFMEIANAIGDHVQRETTRREDEKKTPITAPGSSATSPSPSAAVGATSGSPSLTPMSITS